MRKRQGARERGSERARERESERARERENRRDGYFLRLPPSRSPALPLSCSLALCLSVFSLFVPLIANAQTGEITGRVVTEDGAGMPNVTVYLNPIAPDRRPTMGGSQNRTSTDEDG